MIFRKLDARNFIWNMLFLLENQALIFVFNLLLCFEIMQLIFSNLFLFISWISVSVWLFKQHTWNSFFQVPTLGDSGFFRLQGIKILWRLRPKLKLSWVCPVGCLSLAQFLSAFWNFKLKVLKYSKNCSLHNNLIPWSKNTAD